MFDDKNEYITGNNFYTYLNILQLNCEEEELFDAMDLYNEKKIVLPILRSYLHEHTHFIQHNTTPVGYYITLLKNYQIAYLTKISDEMLKSPEFTYPMMWHIQKRKNEEDRFKRPVHFYYYWYLAEIVRLCLVGNKETFGYYLHEVMHEKFYGMFDFLLELEPVLIKLLDSNYNYDRKIDFSNFTNRTISGLRLKAIFESQALLTEYYFDNVADERLIKALDSNISPEHSDYLLPLKLYKELHSFDLSNKNDFLSFKLGFHAICQIILHTPILPFQDKLGMVSIGDIEIEVRITQLFQSKITPPKSLSDYNRYINELTKDNGYKTLKSVSQNIISNRHLIMNNIIVKYISLKKEEIFLSAQKEYLNDTKNFFLFLGGQATPPRFLNFKFRNKKLSLDTDGCADLSYDLLYQYYKELLMGYNANKSHGTITVSPVVELSDQMMDLLKESFVDLFNAVKPKKFPNIILTKH